LIQLADHIVIADLLLFMPDSNNEPEKYTIEEMLDRLKKRGDGEGQLVSRVDGTQALKVRKRKRRTDQTGDKLKSQNQRTQLIQIAGFIVFMVAMLIIGGILIINANSSAFRNGLVSKIESITGSEVEIQQFRMNPATASAARIEIDWPEMFSINRLEANSLKAKISPISFVGKVFQGQEITAEKGMLFLKAPHSSNSTTTKTKGTSESGIRFQRYSVASLNVFFSKDKLADGMVENIEASYLPKKTGKSGEIRLNRGNLKLKGWPSLALDRSYIQVCGEELDIKSMRFLIPPVQSEGVQDKGTISFSGVISPQAEGATHKLHVELESFQISPLLGNSLGRFFHGKMVTNTDETSNILQFAPGSGQDASLELNVSQATSSRISLSQFKFLGHLSIVLDDRWYELPNFDGKVKLLIKRSGELVKMESIHLEQRARMMIKGTISTKDTAGNISGTLSVGIPEVIVAASKDRRLDLMFSPVKDGYRWINIELSGSGSAPADNFKELYQAVKLTNSPEVKVVPKPQGVDSFDSLIKPE